MRKRMILSFVLALALFLITACGSSGQPTGSNNGTGSSSGGSTTTSQAAAPIKVGVVLSLTGGASLFGQPERDAAVLAAEVLNKKGGINGQQIKLIIEDDKSTPSEALTSVQKLISEDKVVAVIGSSSGSATMAFLKVANEAHIPVVSPTATVAVTQQEPKWVFRTTPVDTVIVTAVLERLKATNLNKVAVLHETAAFGSQATDALVQLAPKYGVEIVAREKYDPKDTDIKPQLTRIKAVNPKVVVVWGTGPAPAIAFKNMRELGMDTLTRIAPLGVATRGNIDAAAGAMDGVLIPGVLDAHNPRPSQKQFVDAYKAKYNRLPTTLDAIAYDPVFLLAQAVESAGNSTGTAIRDALEKISGYQGVVGTYNYSDTNHDGLGTDAVVWLGVKGQDFVGAE